MPASHGRVFYVAGSYGRDASRGTKRYPWRTIQHALARVPLSGSTIYVRGGTYAGEAEWHREGNAANPVTLRAYPGEEVTLTGAEGLEVPAIWVYRAGGIRIRGFDIAAPFGDGIRIENSQDVEVAGCDIHNSGQMGILVVGTGETPPTGNRNVQIWSNRLHDNGGAYISKDPFWIRGDHSVYVGAVSNTTDGIDHSTVGGTIANNLFYNQPYGSSLQLGSEVNGMIVTNNTFDRAYQSDPYAGNAVQIYGNSNPLDTHNVLVVNNILADNAHSAVFGAGGSDAMRTNVVTNNLTWNNPSGDFKDYYGDVQTFTVGPNIVEHDPLFTNAGARDFSLRPDSPARGRSIPDYTPKTDFTGRLRKKRPDLGAIEILPTSHTRQNSH